MEYNYHLAEYWNSRYLKQDGAAFEWLETYERLRDIIL